jgi:5-(carboxyamino)imidazole ribonucleotide synthase
MAAFPLAPGSTIGILGGGQLGRMLALAVAKLGLKSHVYCPEAGSPAFDVAAAFTCAAYEDAEALARFAASVDVVTYEFENVPGKTAAILGAAVPVAPSPSILAITQDRLTEKQFIEAQGIPVPGFANVENLNDLNAAIARLGTPCVLKTRTMGYDGKGQAKIMTPADAQAAWDAIGQKPAIAEAFVPFSAEVSVIVARGRDGQTAVFDVPLNEHRNHILHTSTVPSGLSEATEKAAREIGQKLAQSFDYVGVMAVELFVVGDSLLVNEIAPRVHNSGHWTESACMSSQFEQHIRAVAGWPLASTARFADVQMTNLIGADAEGWAALAAEPGVALHLYGKAEARAGRKMGHVNRLKQR